MSTPPSNTFSPAELAKLEHAFAADPMSDAYQPLAEAYLAMGRFMEAMVVCKKGVKAHPKAVEPRVLLARIYGKQGKDRKALEELAGVLQIAPQNKEALRWAGELQLKLGEAEAGKGNLLKAFEQDPQDAETSAVLSRWKIEPPRPKSAAKEVAKSTGPAASKADASANRGASPSRPGPSVWAAPAKPAQGKKASNGASSPETPTRVMKKGQPAQSVKAAKARKSEDEVTVERLAASSPRPSKRTNLTLVLLLAVPLVGGGYYAWGRWKAQRNREIKKHLSDAAEQLRHDSYESYKKACVEAGRALELDPKSTAAHGYLAYAYALRWGEHGGGDDARKLAEDHLEAAKKGGEISSHLYAAEALIRNYAGKGLEARRNLEQRIKSFDAENRKSSLLYLTLGIIQMNGGDLEQARFSLDTAQALAPDDARIYAALATLHRRRGQEGDALRNFEVALRYERDHPDSLLGKSLLLLTQERPEAGHFSAAAKSIRRLIESDPPPSPRQLAMAQMARSLLISRVSADFAEYKPEFQKELSTNTGVPLDKSRAQAEMLKAEEAGFSLDRQNPELHLIKGRRLLAEGKVDPAASEFRKAIQTDPTRAHFYVELAKALLSKKEGGEKEAQDALISALKVVQDSPKLLVLLGHTYRRQGKLDEALSQYSRAVADPKARNGEARLAMGGIYREKKQYPKAIEFLQRAAEDFLGQEWRVAASYAELARAYEEQGDRTKAEETYQKAVNADHDYTPTYVFYARYLVADPRQPQKAKAKAQAQEYLKRDPKGEFAAEAQKLAQ
jgi:tetratricopeptide (TPR) repeat protein